MFIVDCKRSCFFFIGLFVVFINIMFLKLIVMMKYESCFFINLLKLSVIILLFFVGVIFLMDIVDNDLLIL